MKKVVIFGNSGAGKSTLAKLLSCEYKLAHLDLDSIAWTSTSVPKRKDLKDSYKDIESFLAQNENWVVEGCYSDLIDLMLEHSTEMIYLDLPIAECIANAKARPWEPHKYASKEAQDENLSMLIDWIKAYEYRDDTFSRQAHNHLFRKYMGKKKKIKSNKPIDLKNMY